MGSDPKVVDEAKAKEERVTKLISDIQSINYECETLREHNTLAMILMIRALDIFDARYGEEQMLYILDFVVRDRREKRRTPTTKEYADKVKRMKFWLPDEENSSLN